MKCREVESPKSIQTATAQISQNIANVASREYGGCSWLRRWNFGALCREEYYQKHQRYAEEWVLWKTGWYYAWKKTQKDIYDAMQSLEYEINSLFTSNGQTPFTSLGLSLGTSRFVREIQSYFINIRIKGWFRTPYGYLFPNYFHSEKRPLFLEENSPNYDIKQLALVCATSDVYPDVLSYDKSWLVRISFKVYGLPFSFP